MIKFEQVLNREENMSIIGLGYVGISLAVNFGKVANVIGFDIDISKINQYKKGIDLTNQVETQEFINNSILFTYDESNLKDAKFHIIAVPTPVFQSKIPNLEYLVEASKILGRNLGKGSIVVYESTVFPGVTEDICIPILERHSGLICGIDFKIGYSPERINPGDSINTLSSIVKIVSAMDEETLDTISKIYGLIIKEGIYKAENIKIAEAAKLVENVQRDINIALINEMSIILDKLDIDTRSVLNAIDTKWNALNFKPGLVGGHCIGIDSYYWAYIAKDIGLIPEIVLSGRKVNNYIPEYISEKTINMLKHSKKNIKGSNIAIFGFSFKEDCSDIRNTKVLDIALNLNHAGVNTKIVDHLVDSKEVLNLYGLSIYKFSEISNMDGVIFAVPHKEFLKYSLDKIKSLYSSNIKPILIDIKGIFDRNEAETLGYNYWSL